MATGKRYYWIKLKDSFMSSDTVDYLMSQPNGANYVVLYQMLCLKTINTDGKLSRRIGEILIPYDVEKIQRDCKWFSADTIRVALNLYKSFGLIYEDMDGTLVLTDHSNLVGSETDYAEKNRRMRAQQVAPLESGHNVSSDVSIDVSSDVSENVSIENRDKEIRDKDIRDKEINNIHSFTHSTQARESAGARETGETEEPEDTLESQRKLLGGTLGGGVVMLSDEQMTDLLRRLSLDEFDRYVAVVRDCEKAGKKFRKKTHYQAILDMARKDRDKNGVG